MSVKLSFVATSYYIADLLQLVETMDHTPIIRQTSEFGKSNSTAGKSILNFIQSSSLGANIVKYSPVKFANFV